MKAHIGADAASGMVFGMYAAGMYAAGMHAGVEVTAANVSDSGIYAEK